LSCATQKEIGLQVEKYITIMNSILFDNDDDIDDNDDNDDNDNDDNGNDNNDIVKQIHDSL
jgi:hypothetical protein